MSTRPAAQGPRAPIHTDGARPPLAGEFLTARRLVRDSGVLSVLQDKLDAPTGRPRSLSIEGFLVAAMINGARRQHTGMIVDIARVLNTLSSSQLGDLGIRGWGPAESYDRVDRLFNKLCDALKTGWFAAVNSLPTRIDASWFLDRFIGSSLSDLPARSSTLAVDGTDIETWGRLHKALTEDDLDGDGSSALPKKKPGPSRKANKARVFGIGPDGRNIYTRDVDARGGHRSATNGREEGTYVGYELHLGAQTKDLVWSDGIEGVKFGPDVPPVITTARLVPAGSPRDGVIVEALVAAKGAGEDITEVIWDRGYSQLTAEATTHVLARCGIGTTFRLMDHQRKLKPFSSDALIIEGHLVSAHAPAELRGLLPMPSYGASPKERAECEERFNRLARFRYQHHGGPDEDGAHRWRCPIHAGYLRSRALPASMRRSVRAPLVNLPDGASCCGGTVTTQAAELPFHQRLFPGTSAWTRSYGRRQVVEGANAGLKGGFVNIASKFFRVMGTVKMTVLLAFTVAGYNLERIRSFLAKHAPTSAGKVTRRKRRTGTWGEILDPSRAGSGPDPPAA